MQCILSRVVLVGDPKQLPATVKSLVAQKLSLARSLFERLQVRFWMTDMPCSLVEKKLSRARSLFERLQVRSQSPVVSTYPFPWACARVAHSPNHLHNSEQGTEWLCVLKQT